MKSATRLKHFARKLVIASMMKSPRHCYEFGHFRLDPSERQLLRGGQVMPLTPKVFDTLLLFVENSNLLLTKDEMIARLWPDSFVEEGNLAQNVSVLRRALGDQPDGKPYIETVPKRGYRFTVDVMLCPEEPRGEPALSHSGAEGTGEYERRAGEASELTPPGRPQINESVPRAVASGSANQDPLATARGADFPSTSNGAKPSVTPSVMTDAGRRKRGAVWMTIALIVIAAGGAYLLLLSTASPRSEGKLRLAVLPFRNLGSADKTTDTLSNSLADEVITKLNYISALTVRPSVYIHKYANKEIDPRQVASELNVDILLIGTFVKEGDDLRINLQLVDVAATQTLWIEALHLKYEKVMTVQDQVSQAVVRRMSVSLTPAESDRLQRSAVINLQAYEYHLQGVDLYHKDHLKMAGVMFEKSVGLDPTYASSWAYLGAINTTLASTYFGGREYYDKARQAYDRALELDPGQIEARIFKANLLTDIGHVEEAVPLLRGVIAATPNLAQAHWNLAYAYRFGGLLQESISEGERSRQINGAIKADNSVFNAYLYDGQYEKFLQSLPTGENSAYITFYRGLGHHYLKQWRESAAHFDQAYNSNKELMQAQIGKALSYGLAGQPGPGLNLLRDVEDKIVKSGVADAEGVYKIAQAFAVLNDKPTALRLLRRSIQGGFFCYPYFTNDPLLDNLRGDPEFAELMELARRRHEDFKRQFSN